MDYKNPDAIHHNMRVDPNGIHRNITEYVDSLKNLASWAQNVARDDRAKTLPAQSDDYATFWDNVANNIAATVSALEELTNDYTISRTCQSLFHINHTNCKCTQPPGHNGWHEAYWHGQMLQWGITP